MYLSVCVILVAAALLINPTKPSLSELVGLINNEEFYGAVTLKTLCAEKEYMDYVLKCGY